MLFRGKHRDSTMHTGLGDSHFEGPHPVFVSNEVFLAAAHHLAGGLPGSVVGGPIIGGGHGADGGDSAASHCLLGFGGQGEKGFLLDAELLGLHDISVVVLSGIARVGVEVQADPKPRFLGCLVI